MNVRKKLKEKFTLLETLSSPKKEKKDLLPKGIKYQEYIVEVNNTKEKVFVPLRESGNFEKTLSEVNLDDQESLQEVLRKHRCIRNKE